MTHGAYMTTSWDDGHPLDHRLARLLDDNGLAGTFYIPRQAETGTMSEADIHDLSIRYEIGAHTMRHTFLNTVSDEVAQQEIAESKAWVEVVTGTACEMFCPPAGKFSARDLNYMRQAGYSGMRSVELMSIDLPREDQGLFILPTTVHAHPHGPLVYLKNAVKRRKPGNLWRYITQVGTAGWVKLAETNLKTVAAKGGVFHLWGHSWEIEQAGQWEGVKTVLNIMGEYKSRVLSLTNSQLCKAVNIRRIASPSRG
jgi:peptidoglycan/xylan/chitin deacetylase (PgdA/CDA1 family)